MRNCSDNNSMSWKEYIQNKDSDALLDYIESLESKKKGPVFEEILTYLLNGNGWL